ncbi:MFS transporter [Plantactinospora sp. KBS50]|uniref:MFS transporter n=1 Tax=Plantactinospora sp. KBS50 TaxID=2024580 RepID=UPI000BAAAE6C|nr:MFS transporter [Plantactinospora sp. KBS50]ASW54116.1 MFS transporter [Plantactinospora sp. KBS50]
MTTEVPAPVRVGIDVAPIRRRTLRLLFMTQIIGGIGVTIGVTVGALLARDNAGTAVSGLASSCAVVGAALLAVPVTRVMAGYGRRPGLALAYLCGAAGGLLVVVAAVHHWVPLLFAGMLLFGGGSAANLQARYAAVDLAEPARRARQLSLVVWATTIGAVAAPNFATLADATTRGLGLPRYAGPFAFSAAAFVLAAVLLLVLLRPDPLLTARRLAAAGAAGTADPPGAGAAGIAADPPGTTRPVGRYGLRDALRVVAARPDARLGMAAVAVGHVVMVAVMTMTPVRIGESHGDADVLRLVGLVLSLHIAGMYALSPLVGWSADRFGRRAVILGGVAVLLVACAVAGSAGHDTPWLAVGLVLLGLGWSATMVAGSTLLSESVPGQVRPAAQGLTDLVMGLAGASAGGVSGFVVQFAGYPVLTALAAVAAVPLLALALRRVPAMAAGAGGG